MRNDIYNSFMHNDIEKIEISLLLSHSETDNIMTSIIYLIPLPLDGGPLPLPYGRAPKGPLLNSRACLRILMVEREIDGGLSSRADGGLLVERSLPLPEVESSTGSRWRP
jgi:hypothetical protein